MKEIWRKLILSTKLPRVVTIIGGGGKTNLMHFLLTILKAKGFAAVGTSTTKLSSQPVSGTCFVQVESAALGYQVIKQAQDMGDHNILVYGEEDNISGKLLGIPAEWIDQWATACREVVFIVEGDGAAGKPLKGHLGHEPVIPASSSLVVPVFGIDSIGVELHAQNMHRPERICELTGVTLDSVVTKEMISQLLFHPQGYLHNCSKHTAIVPFINKVESAIKHQQAEEVARQILEYHHPQIGGVIIGSLLQEEGLWLQG